MVSAELAATRPAAQLRGVRGEPRELRGQRVDSLQTAVAAHGVEREHHVHGDGTLPSVASSVDAIEAKSRVVVRARARGRRPRALRQRRRGPPGRDAPVVPPRELCSRDERPARRVLPRDGQDAPRRRRELKISPARSEKRAKLAYDVRLRMGTQSGGVRVTRVR